MSAQDVRTLAQSKRQATVLCPIHWGTPLPCNGFCFTARAKFDALAQQLERYWVSNDRRLYEARMTRSSRPTANGPNG